MKLVVIIPAYNEEESIGSVIKRIPKVNERISKTEVIVVDGSRKVYKCLEYIPISNLRIVSMIPGDREVAGCFNLSNFGGFF